MQGVQFLFFPILGGRFLFCPIFKLNLLVFLYFGRLSHMYYKIKNGFKFLGVSDVD